MTREMIRWKDGTAKNAKTDGSLRAKTPDALGNGRGYEAQGVAISNRTQQEEKLVELAVESRKAEERLLYILRYECIGKMATQKSTQCSNNCRIATLLVTVTLLSLCENTEGKMLLVYEIKAKHASVQCGGIFFTDCVITTILIMDCASIHSAF